MTRIVLFFFILITFQSSLLAQMPGFTQFDSNIGLPSNTVYDITQDENGFIWMATDYGLSRFDGLSFKNFTIADGLPDNEILHFFQDSKKRIWLSGFNGKLGYIQKQKFYNSENSKLLNELKFNIFISDIFEDSKNNIWFFESFNNIKKLDTNNQVSTYNFKNTPQLNNSKQYNIAEDIHGEIKILKSITHKSNLSEFFSSSISKLNWENLNFDSFDASVLIKLRTKKSEKLKNVDSVSMKILNEILKIYSYKSKSNLLYRTFSYNDSFIITNLDNGALLINPKNSALTKKILPLTRTTVAFVDSEKNIWIGTQSDGVFLFPNLNVHGIQFEDKTQNDLHTVSLFQNKLVIGNGQSEIFILDKKTLQTIKTFLIDKKPKRIRHLNVINNILSILSDLSIHQLNSNFELERFKNMYDTDFKKTRLQNFKDLSISEDYIYTANANGVAKIDKKNKTPQKIWNKRSSAICVDEKENLWIGTTTGLFYESKGITNKFNLNKQFNNSIIYALKHSQNGLLIGSNSYGLGILKNDKFTTISINDGLLSNYIKSIYVDPKNNIWLSTNFGLNCVELDDKNQIISIKSYTTSDGLYSNDVRASYIDENKVYVATSKGLNIIDLNNELTIIAPPITQINTILLNNKEIEKINNQEFNHRLNNFQFTFSGISFKSLGNISFKYHLKGLEPDWIPTKTNTVRYSSLPPNNYTFELIAISKNKLESNPISYTFTIKPPFYLTWWFIGLTGVTIFSLLAFILYNRNLKIKRRRETKEQISNLRYQALNAQMNPHFINNLLVNIHNLADKGEMKEVKVSLDKFAELVNLILNATKSNLINLSDEIKMAKLYLDLQKLRFNKNTTYTINTDEISYDLESILVPPMILQPILENCFKHGFKNENKANTIHVNFKIENDTFLICKISDNGIGIKQFTKDIPISKSSGISFSNINERLRLINESKNDKNLVFISNLTDEFDNLVGLKVTLKIPLISF